MSIKDWLFGFLLPPGRVLDIIPLDLFAAILFLSILIRSTQGKGALLTWLSLHIANIFAEDRHDSFSINCYTVALAGT